MRPLRLEVEGFSTFRDRVALDFTGLELVAFTGSTGAGKSTLIDAITFALYGSVARYENAGRVAPVIHQLSTQAKVRLDFEAGGRTYIATRVVRRRNTRAGESDSASTREARLELVDGDNPEAETTVLAGDVKELNAAVEELLGLDFRQFTRTIVLPQGEFSAFLRDDPANRDKLLQRLLDLGVYERMGQLARSQAKKSGHQAEILAEQQERTPPLSDTEFKALEATTAELATVRSEVADRLDVLAELDARLDPLRDEVKAIDQALGRLETIELPDDLPGLDRDLSKASAVTEAAKTELATARTARDQAFAAVDNLPDKGELVRVQSLGEQLAESREKTEQLTGMAAEVDHLIERLTTEQADIEVAARNADSALRSARLAADAAGWTAALVTGEPCPVCHRQVDTIPDHDSAHELELATEEHRKLESESVSIAKQLAKATGTAQASAEEIERQSERVDLLLLQLSTYDGSTDPADLNSQLEAVELAEQTYRTEVAAVTELEGVLQAATDAESRVATALQSMRSQLSTMRDSVADLEPPTLAHQSLVDDYDQLQRWAKDTAAALTGQRAGLAAEGKAVANQRSELLVELASLADSAGVDGDIAGLRTAIGDALADAKAAVTAAEQRRTEHQAIAGQIADLRADQVLNDALGKHLRAGGFGSWLLAEALDNIVAKATVWLLELSNNQYSLVAGDKNFAIIDHNNADETRDVRTLSGGETFLASLALALALADSIAELAPVDSPRLESMFLDEGFGTLDPGTLDVVAAAIEELASTGRMIGIVTHVGELAERMPARFEVTKGPSTSTVQLVEV